MTRFVSNTVARLLIALILLAVLPPLAGTEPTGFNAPDLTFTSMQSSARIIAGQVVGAQKQPLPNAEVGLQVWAFGQDRASASDSFTATATTDDQGQFRLAVPEEIEPKKLLACVWAIAPDHMPIRPNSFGSLAGLLSRKSTTIRLAPTPGVVLRVLQRSGEPAEGVRVGVTRQRLPQSVAYLIPAEWQTRMQGQTDDKGFVRLPHVVPEALAEVILDPADGSASIQLNQNFFLNARPASTEPHFTWKLPETGSVSGRLAIESGQLPPGLTITLRTESLLEDSGSRVGTWGTATVPVDAEGQFTVHGIAVGPLVVPPFLADDQPLRAEIPERVAVRSGKTTELMIPVRRGVLLKGVIRKGDTKEGYPRFSLSVIYGQSAREHRDMRQKLELETDDEGKFTAHVPPGPIELRLHSAPADYRDVGWWGDRTGLWGERRDVPAGVESFELDPIELVPAKSVQGKLVDANRDPLQDWVVYGYPEIPGLPRDQFRMNCVAGVHTNQKGQFSGSYPSTVPPAFWQASNRKWPTPYEFDDDKWDVKILSETPLLLQVDFSPRKNKTRAEAGESESAEE